MRPHWKHLGLVLIILVVLCSSTTQVAGLKGSGFIQTTGNIHYSSGVAEMKVGIYVCTWNFREWTAQQIADYADMAQAHYASNWHPHNDYDAKIAEARSIALAQGTEPIKVLLYYNFPYVKASVPDDLEYCRDQGWILKDSAGAEVLADNPYNPTYATDIGNPEYRAWVANLIKSWLDAHPSLWDGVMSDNSFRVNAEHYNWLFNSSPINPRTGALWADQEVRDAFGAWLNTLMDTTGRDVLPNGIGNGRMWQNWNADYLNLLGQVPGLWAIMSESWLYPSYSSKWWTESDWLKSVDLLVDMQDLFLEGQPNRYYVCGAIVNYDGNITPTSDDEQILLFGYCSVLLGAKYSGQNLLLIGFSNENLSSVTLDTIKRLRAVDVGNPIGNYYRISGTSIYTRDFTGGKVLVNPSDVPYSVSLGTAYTDWKGATVTSVVCEPHTGTLLFRVVS